MVLLIDTLSYNRAMYLSMQFWMENWKINMTLYDMKITLLISLVSNHHFIILIY